MEYMESDLKRDRVQQDENGKKVFDENGNPIMLPEREVSLDKLIDEDWDYASSEPTPEEVVGKRFEMELLNNCLDLLKTEERELVDALFFSNGGVGMTEREYAAVSGIPQKTINDRKLRILSKLKKLLEK